MPEILAFAKSKNVRVWLWAHWTDIDRQMDEAFPLFEKWGIAGVKIDFMNRDDQWMTDFYRRVVKKAAEHHLMIDFHGAYKPDGLTPHLSQSADPRRRNGPRIQQVELSRDSRSQRDAGLHAHAGRPHGLHSRAAFATPPASSLSRAMCVLK